MSKDTAAPGGDFTQAKSFTEFYPYYLLEHRNLTCRRLHFVGSSLGLVCLALAVARADWRFILLGLFCGYLCAWIGHFVFEKNRPATFKRPLWSFMGDWVMYKDVWLGRVKL